MRGKNPTIQESPPRERPYVRLHLYLSGEGERTPCTTIAVSCRQMNPRKGDLVNTTTPNGKPEVMNREAAIDRAMQVAQEYKIGRIHLIEGGPAPQEDERARDVGWRVARCEAWPCR